ncbi:hypothetical protein C8Q75DRAFT_60315 [Abortiporus biennis]|nr:hypothetical protein C8Q75DRAFT_60315 [Abortiporus biennis]
MHDPSLLVDGKPHLILNDFDLAMFINRDGSPASDKSSTHRTGTLPFMACDILKNTEKPHYLRHDLESTVYMAWWIAINYPFDSNGQPQKKKDILLRWEKGTFGSISKFKHSFLTDTNEHKEFLLAVSSDFKKYGTWLAAFRNIFHKGYAAEINAGGDISYKDGEMLMKQESGDNAEEQLRLQQIQKMKEDETMFGFVTALTIKAALEKERNKLELLVEDFVME